MKGEGRFNANRPAKTMTERTMPALYKNRAPTFWRLLRETRIVYDSNGRQVSRTLPLGYGEDGRLGTSDDANAESFTESFEYNDLGQLILHTSFEGAKKQYLYALSRRLTTEYFSLVTGAPETNLGPEHIVRLYQDYDNHGRPLNVFVPGDGRSESTTYDSQGRVLTTSTSEGNIRYGYDNQGRMISKKWSGSGYVAQPGADYENETQYSYDALGRLAMVKQVRQAGTTMQVPDETEYGYDASGNLKQTRYQNGVIHDYVYDALGRLELLEHWHDKNDNGRRDYGELRAQFDYMLRADGKRIGATEKVWDEAGFERVGGSFLWTYDEADRLVEEVSNGVFPMTYTLDWVYDLVGNRVNQTKTIFAINPASPPTIERTLYDFDANDRLLGESFTKSTGTTVDSTSASTYAYNKTQQTSKTTVGGATGTSPVTTTQMFSYNRQGLMASVITQTSNESVLKRVDYSYDTAGNRVGSAQFQANTQSPTTWTQQTSTRYLTDSQNPTGYSQVLQEIEYVSTGAPAKKTIYTIGHDQISQTVYDHVYNSDTLSWEPTVSTYYFGTDGHGSVRVLYDAAAAIAQHAGLQQVYSKGKKTSWIRIELSNNGQTIHSYPELDVDIPAWVRELL
jgi:YD repeat-containing protein